MPPDPNQPPADSSDAARLARLEARLARLEDHLGLAAQTRAPAAGLTPPLAVVHTEDELEFEVGQNWFAFAGIIALTLGAAFLLLLPFASLPAAAPALAGYVVVAVLFGLAHAWRVSFALVAGYLRGAGLALLFLATLRLYYPAARPVLSTQSVPGGAWLVAVVAFNFLIALRRRSAWLAGVALLTGCAAALAIPSAWFSLVALLLLAAFAVGTGHRQNWPGLTLAAIPLAHATYLFWALGLAARSGALHWATAPAIAPAFLLVMVIILAAAAWLRPKDEPEGAVAGISALLNCGLGYGLYVVHTAVAFPTGAAAQNFWAGVVFLGLAVAFWQRRQSRAATFFYAMTGYAALSVALARASAVPLVFVWLSLQSVLVVATAIWFRSRFIVVANFLIYVCIVLGYMIVAERESGVSLTFGAVALVSARILNWQQGRLELKTGLMRNAYLAGAFLVFPYALYHLVPVRYVGLAWVGLALGYYTLNLLVQNQKYRWMGHTTLLLTTCYVVVAGTRGLEPVYRVLSFLVLGTVLLIVSLVFTRLRKRQRDSAAAAPSAGS